MDAGSGVVEIATAVRAGLGTGWGRVAVAEVALVPHEEDGKWKRPGRLAHEARRPWRRPSG